MNRIAYCLLLLLATACVQFKPATLYVAEASEPKPQRPDDISMLVGTEIFLDDTVNVWGIRNEAGKEAYLSKTIKKAGEAAIYIKWDRSQAEWTGFGAGWDDWAGKDLTGVRDYTAFEFYVRSEKGRMYSVPMVMSLEDYSGVSAYAYVSLKYFERFTIDEEWQRVQVPLTAFDLNEFGVDFSNIKQLQVELQQSGSLYIDEIRLVPYEPKPEKPWLVEETLPDPTTLPKVLFDDKFPNNHGYGLMTYACQDIQLTYEDTHSGRTAIVAVWDDSKGDCRTITFGMSWHKWRPFDINPIWKEAAVEFYLKTMGEKHVPQSVSLALADKDLNFVNLEIAPSYTTEGRFTGDWQKVICPLADFKGNWNPKNARQLNFVLEGKGKIWVDDIRLVAN